MLIAAAMLNEPQLLLGDEPTSALDMTSQMQVMKELELLKAEHRVSMILVSHNLRAISQIADTAAVMYGGRIVEYGSREELFSRCAFILIPGRCFAALPDAEGNLSAGLPGLPPAFEKEMRGCPFAARCPYSMEKCRRETAGRPDVRRTPQSTVFQGRRSLRMELLRVEGLTKRFWKNGRWLTAV